MINSVFAMYLARITMMLPFWFSPSLLHAAVVSRCIDLSFLWTHSSFPILIYLFSHSKHHHFSWLQCFVYICSKLNFRCTSSAVDFRIWVIHVCEFIESNVCKINRYKYEQMGLKPHENRSQKNVEEYKIEIECTRKVQSCAVHTLRRTKIWNMFGSLVTFLWFDYTLYSI